MKNKFLVILGISLLACSNNSIKKTTSNTTNSLLAGTALDLTIAEAVTPSLSQSSQLATTGASASSSPCTDVDANTTTCDCSDGGTVTYTYSDLPDDQCSDPSITTDKSIFTVTYTDCIMSVCDEPITLNGSITTNKETNWTCSTDPHAGSSIASFTIASQTTSSCTGLTATDNSGSTFNFGFNVTQSYVDGSDDTFSGTICIEDTSTDFTSLEELQQSLDPNATCDLSSEAGN